MSYARFIAESLGPFVAIISVLLILGWAQAIDERVKPLPFRREWEAFIAETPRG